MKKFFAEFRTFISRGNVIDMAIGVLIGASFKAIIDSFMNDIISPILGLIVKTNFSNLVFTINDVTVAYGSFITAILNFLLTAFVLFLVVRMSNRARALKDRKKQPAPVKVKTCPYCQSEISIKATRCPHCTSEQPAEAKSDSDEM